MLNKKNYTNLVITHFALGYGTTECFYSLDHAADFSRSANCIWNLRGNVHYRGMYGTERCFQTSRLKFVYCYIFQFEECPQQLYKCDWYTWNKENKLMFLLFVVLADQEQNIKIFPTIKIRLSDLLWVKIVSVTLIAVSI